MNNYNFFADRPIENTHQGDRGFILLVILLWGLGIFTLVVCSENVAQRIFQDQLYFVKRQLISSFCGMILFVLFATLRIKTIRRLLPIFVIGIMILCLMTFLPGIGVEKKGAVRWIKLPFFSTFQPSEFAKFAIVLFLANLFDKNEKKINPSERSVFSAVLGLCIFVLIIFAQKDFSTGIFVFLVGIIMFFVSGARLGWLIPVSSLAIPAGMLMVFLEQYRMNRLIAFIKPMEDIQGINYQAFAAHRAINAGGFWGQGIGAGLTKLNGIPEVQADYIFAGWAEATGLLGVVIYFILLMFFAFRAYRISFISKDRFSSLGAFGCTTVIFFQSLLNCAVVGGVVPNTGIPLPFFSSGGSSMMITLAMCGFIFNASRSELDTDLITESLHGVQFYE